MFAKYHEDGEAHIKSRLITIIVTKFKLALKFRFDDSGVHIQDSSSIVSENNQTKSHRDSHSKYLGAQHDSIPNHA